MNTKTSDKKGFYTKKWVKFIFLPFFIPLLLVGASEFIINLVIYIGEVSSGKKK